MLLRTLLTIAAIIFATLGPVRAGGIGDADRSAIQEIIAGQLTAFGADDGGKAYGYASPTIQLIFPNSEAFMAMVRQGYPQVYRPQRYGFGRIEEGATGMPAQHVIIVGPDGKTYEAVYTMQRQPDGSWKINGCTMALLSGVNA